MTEDLSQTTYTIKALQVQAWVRKTLWVLLALTMMVGMQSYFQRVLLPAQLVTAQDGQHGNFSDLYPRWLGARELLLHGRDPYSAEITAEIQKGYWGRKLDPANPNDPADQLSFAYPLYMVFLLAPTINLPFHTVQILYRFVAVILSVVSVWFWMRVFGHRPSVVSAAVTSLLLLGSYPVVQSLLLQQPTLVVAALIAAVFAAIAGGLFGSAGIILALAMIKPQLTLPIAAWLMLWSVSKWRERKALFLFFATTMLALCAGAERLLPGWLWQWRQAVSDYAGYALSLPAQVQLLFGRMGGIAIGAGVCLAIAVFCWKARRDPVSSDRFKLVVPLILSANLVVNPVWHGYDLVFLLPAALLVFHWRNQVLEMRPFEAAIVSFSALILGWQWMAATALSTVALVSTPLAQRWMVLPWLSVLFAPVLVLFSLALIARDRLSRASPERTCGMRMPVCQPEYPFASN